MKSAKKLMIQGTGSSVGKSVLVAALCRIFKRRGISVAPFKSQNMSLNSFVTAEGYEIGRAQAVQAEAAGILPSVLMNPVLLKPCADHTSQVIVSGKVRTTLSAKEYHTYRASLRTDVLAAFEALSTQYDLILMEGAGSPAEINLRQDDLANMGAAELVDAPVVLVGDIDRGGVFASLYGTVKLLEASEQSRIKGYIINKFRGDVDILRPGLTQMEALLGIPSLGVLPYWDLAIDEEDSLGATLDKKAYSQNSTPAGVLDIAVIRLPRMSNYTDFAVFNTFDDVRLRYVNSVSDLGEPDLIVLPGSKNTISDLGFVRHSGLEEKIRMLHAQATPVIGICGGFQMLGKTIRDPERVESSVGQTEGLGLLGMQTVFAPTKRTSQTTLHVIHNSGLLQGCAGLEVSGYEIHMGQSFVTDEYGYSPLGARLENDTGQDGLVSVDGMVMGTYLHGIFDSIQFTRQLLNNLRLRRGWQPLHVPSVQYASFKDSEYDRLADLVESHLDMPRLEAIIESWR